MCDFEPWGSKITWKVYLETCKNIYEAFRENSWSNCLTAADYFHKDTLSMFDNFQNMSM